MPSAQLQLQVDRIGDLLTAGDRVFVAGERRVHLLRAAEIKLVALHAHPVRVGAKLARVDAQQHILRHGVFAANIVGVARRHCRQTYTSGQVGR